MHNLQNEYFRPTAILGTEFSEIKMVNGRQYTGLSEDALAKIVLAVISGLNIATIAVSLVS